MKVTKHALTRVLRGDSAGLRTKLSIEEVIAKVKSPEAIKVGREVFFWSEVDDECLMAITAQRDTVLITVYPANRDMSPWMAILSKYRYLKQSVFKDIGTTTYDPHKAIQVELTLYNEKNGFEGAKDIGHPFCVWFDFAKCDSPMFWSRDFHKMLADMILQYLQEHEMSKKQAKELRIRLHGNGWACLLPAYLPFELLEIKNPLG